VFFGGKPAARMGDQCAHGGAITVGCPTVLIGEAGGGSAGMAAMPTPVIMSVMKGMPAEAQQKMKHVVAFKSASQNGKCFIHKGKKCPQCGNFH
jgi:hypothetical protein